MTIELFSFFSPLIYAANVFLSFWFLLFFSFHMGRFLWLFILFNIFLFFIIDRLLIFSIISTGYNCEGQEFWALQHYWNWDFWHCFRFSFIFLF